MLTLSSLGYEEAQKAIEAGFAAAARFGRPMAFAIADANGDIIASARMDGAPSRVMRQTLRKVYTAANMARNTLTLKRDLEDRDNTMWDWGDPNFTTLQGGLVVKMNAASGGSPVPGDEVLGAVACGGGTIDTDEEVAQIMVRAMGFEPVIDRRLLPKWSKRSFTQPLDQRVSVHLPIAAHWMAKGQDPVTAVRLRNHVFTSGVPGIDMKTGLLPEDPARQFECAFENLQMLLESLGVQLHEIGLLTYYISDAKYRGLINRDWRRYFPTLQRPARKTNQVALPEGMVVQLQVSAVCGGQVEPLEIPGLWHRDPLPMGARVGPMVFSSVMGGQDPATGEMSADPQAQIRQAFANLEPFMQQAGGSLDDINHLWVFLQEGFAYHDCMVDTWVKTFPDEASRPARKTLPYRLAGDMQIQLQVTGMLGGQRRNFEIENVHHNDPIPMGSRIGALVHSSGIAGLDPIKGKGVRAHFGSTAVFMVEGGLIAETEMALSHLSTFMTNAGGSLDDIAQLTILVKHLSDVTLVLERVHRLFPHAERRPALRFINYPLPAQMQVQFHVTGILGAEV